MLTTRSFALETISIAACYDGDTCRATTGEKIRLACIDTPELRGKNAKPAPAMAAKYHLNGMLMNQKVGIRRITTDRYGRTVGELFINGINVQQAMVASGHAEIYWRYAPHASGRANHKGLIAYWVQTCSLERMSSVSSCG